MRSLLTTLLLTFLLALPVRAESLPPDIDKCFRTAVTELMLVNRTERDEVKKLFLKHIDADLLGGRAVGGRAWRDASPKWKAKALDMYFDLLYTDGDQLTKGMRDATNSVITARLAKRPDIKATDGLHVVASVRLDNGKQFGVAVLVTPSCKAFDFAQGDWASRFLDASDVDAALRQ